MRPSQFATVSRVPRSDTLNLPYSGYTHTHLFVWSVQVHACRMYVCIITISLNLATFCSPYRDTSPFSAEATIDIIIFTKSSGGVAEKFAHPSFFGSFAKPFCHQLLWIPLLFNVSSHGSWMGSVHVLDLATLHGVRSNTRILSRCSTSSCLASRTSPARLTFRHSRDPRKCCLPALRAYLLTVPLLLVFAAWFPFVAHMVISP